MPRTPERTDLFGGPSVQSQAAIETDTVAIGDDVIGISGALRGAKAVVVGFETVPTPTGGTIRLVKVRRPRAGESYTFPHTIRRVTDAGS